MQVRQATSLASTPAEAARERHEARAGSDLALVLFFCAPDHATPDSAAEIAAHFGEVPVVGCARRGRNGAGRLPRRRGGGGLPPARRFRGGE